jgi:starvation-inducible DNA-binding protein
VIQKLKKVTLSMSNLFRTKNDLPERVRAEIVNLLNQRLADAIDPQSQCKQAHGNVKGENFIALHELVDKVNENVEDHIDLIAERSVQLGGTAEGTVRMVAKGSLVSECSAPSAERKAHAEALSHALATFGEFARQGIASADTLNDADTADIFTEISRGVDKWLWIVEAHLVGSH